MLPNPRVLTKRKGKKVWEMRIGRSTVKRDYGRVKCGKGI